MSVEHGRAERYRRAFLAVLGRELLGARRNRTYLLLAGGVTAVVFGVALTGTGVETGYVPTVVDLLLPAEVLVPAVAFAVGYRSVVDDSERGELTVFRTYPLPAPTYVGGVYVGRLVALLGVVLLPLVLLGVYVAATASPETTVFATHRGIDSPVLYLRFLALTAVLAGTALAVAVAASALSGSRRRAIVFGLLALVVVVAGADLTLLGSLGSGLVGEGGLATILAASPTSAYRGLVFETVLSVAFENSSGFVAPGIAVGGLFLWTVGSLAAATVAVARGE
jgi:ABC-type transport system involved in multi-copper enzyme maturation permease subunit